MEECIDSTTPSCEVFVPLVYVSDYRKPILHGDHKLVVHNKNTCVPVPCRVVGKGVRVCSWLKIPVS